MYLETLWLTDFRGYAEAEFSPAASGITVVTGSNGEGKTNLVEAVAYLATLKSVRGSPADAMVRSGAPSGTAIVRAAGCRESRRILIEAELHATGRDRVQVNGQPLRRSRDLLGALQVTTFAPDDLELVKGGPQHRRGYVDDLLVSLHPRYDAVVSEVDRVLKQRNALLKSAGGSTAGRGLQDDVSFTLDVWDRKLASAGEELAEARLSLAEALQPLAGEFYRQLASASPRSTIMLSYRPSWTDALLDALGNARSDDLRRGVTTVGPHRDEVDLAISGLPARTHGSQGEQRCLALSLRLAAHKLVTDRVGSPPILLLDDVFSELDPVRSEALLGCLPSGQAIVTTAGHIPSGADVRARYVIEDGKILS